MKQRSKISEVRGLTCYTVFHTLHMTIQLSSKGMLHDVGLPQPGDEVVQGKATSPTTWQTPTSCMATRMGDPPSSVAGRARTLERLEKLPPSPSDPQLASDLRRTALLRSLLLRTEEGGTPGMCLSNASSTGVRSFGADSSAKNVVRLMSILYCCTPGVHKP